MVDTLTLLEGGRGLLSSGEYVVIYVNLDRANGPDPHFYFRRK
jgi:hypothetical protein